MVPRLACALLFLYALALLGGQGAAYEPAVKTGRWPDAWLYHRLVSAGTDPVYAESLVLRGEGR